MGERAQVSEIGSGSPAGGMEETKEATTGTFAAAPEWARGLLEHPGEGGRYVRVSDDEDRELFVTRWIGAEGGRAVAAWEIAAWDTKMLGIRCAKILDVREESGPAEAESGERRVEALLRRVRAHAAESGVRNLFLRMGTDRLVIVRAAEAAEFRTIGVHLDFERHLAGTGPEPGSAIRKATLTDADAVSRLGSVFRNDRFHRDGGFDRRRVERLWRESIRNGVTTWADGAYVHEREGKILGFVLVTSEAGEASKSPGNGDARPNGQVGRIFLIGVDPGSRGAGVGSDLVRAALFHGRERGFPAVRVGTQSENRPAIALYQRWGFSLRRVSCELSSWIDEGR